MFLIEGGFRIQKSSLSIDILFLIKLLHKYQLDSVNSYDVQLPGTRVIVRIRKLYNLKLSKIWILEMVKIPRHKSKKRIKNDRF